MNLNRTDYATHADFCAIFRQHMDRLYLLALILTGDELIAEKCFLAALDSCTEERLVFRESAVSWSRRSVIKSAIRFTSPTPGSPTPHPVGNRDGLNLDQHSLFKCLQELPHFDRFVFVMSVLERFSDRDCALLLNCSYAEILPARIRGFQQISMKTGKGYPTYTSVQPRRVDAD